jgi:ubiquitin carboxyl-terminal hydrolase 7
MLITKNFFELQKIQLSPFNGIYNEGATCYMNSMLQTLFSISPFKKAVFQIPTEKENSRSIVLSLQRLFYDLIYNHSPASTKNLINSFGWTQEQIQIQHDVQEFNVLLSEVMEEKMKKTPVEGTFSRLFEGKYLNYIKCINIDFHSEKMEKFYDLQLTIKGYKDIYQSLDDYIKEEILDNDNKYDTEKYGKQKAKKRIKFLNFPPVLILQLKRIEYNSRKEIMVKINDHYEYYDEINLSKYIEKNTNKDIFNLNHNEIENNNLNNENLNDNIYTLHSVVVHQGNATSGHYYAYIKPSINKKEWLLFNDDLVKPADPYEIFQQNFGGNIEVYKNKGGKEIITNSINYERSAYILVYIRKNIQEELIDFDNIDYFIYVINF